MGIVAVAGIAAIALLAFWWSKSNGALNVAPESAAQTAAQTPGTAASTEVTPSSGQRVAVTRPRVGGVVKQTTQPGTVEAFDFADLYAKISGYLDTQKVDIGDSVKAGQLLAHINAPELIQAVHQANAELGQANAQVHLMEASLDSAKADVAAAAANVEEKEADLKRATAYFEFRKIQYDRINDLFKLKSIDERMVDEKRQERDSAESAENVARAAIRTAKAELGAKQAKVKEAEANVANAKSKVQLAAATLEKANVFVSYTSIVSPYDGLVTKRNFHVGDFIRAAEQGGQTPLLTVARTDLMRVVLKMPEDYVPFTDPGDAADVRLKFMDREFHGKVSRIANSVDRLDKTMRTEVDLKNTDNELRDGMFGYVTVHLSKSVKGLSVPSTSLISDAEGKSTSVFVVRDGRLHRIPVKVTGDTGVSVEILSGLRPDDLVVVQPTDDLTEGAQVQTEEVGNAASLPARSRK